VCMPAITKFDIIPLSKEYKSKHLTDYVKLQWDMSIHCLI